MQPEDLRVEIFADGADLQSIIALSQSPVVRGFTTNPSLMRAAGVDDYRSFAKELLDKVNDRPVSLEVFSDDFDEMEVQAKEMASWGDNVYVKIPVTNTSGIPSEQVVRNLAVAGCHLNITALFTPHQVEQASKWLEGSAPSFLSVFAGRIADAGQDPVPIMRECLAAIADHPQLKLIWASPREILNIVQANAIGCHIITVTGQLLDKLQLLGKDLDTFSLETVQMFHRDAKSAAYTL